MNNLGIGSLPLAFSGSPGEGGTKMQGSTPDALVDRQPLRFEAPVSLDGDIEVARNSWRRMQFALDMLSPHDFPSSAQLSDQEKGVLERFHRVANELGDSAVVNIRWHFKATFRPGQEDEVSGKLPSHLEMAGFAAYLRQCDSQHETAGFAKV